MRLIGSVQATVGSVVRAYLGPFPEGSQISEIWCLGSSATAGDAYFSWATFPGKPDDDETAFSLGDQCVDANGSTVLRTGNTVFSPAVRHAMNIQARWPVNPPRGARYLGVQFAPIVAATCWLGFGVRIDVPVVSPARNKGVVNRGSSR